MRLVLTAAGVAVTALIAAPGARATPTLIPIKRCYVSASETEREQIAIHGSGFTPNATIDTYLDNVLVPVTGTADIVGGIDGMVQAPFYASGQRLFTLRLAEAANPANAVETTSKVTALSVDQIPRKARTDDSVRFRGRGFTSPGVSVYGHWVYNGKVVKTVRLAKPYGDCGLFSRKIRQFPFAHPPKAGEWTIQFDQDKAYDPNANARYSIGVHVTTRIKRPG